MSRRFITAAAGILVMAAAAGAAQAATFFPNDPVNSTPFTMTGTLTLHQLTTINCQVTLYGAVKPGGASAEISGGSFSAGDWQCGWLVSPTGFAWTVTPDSVLPAKITITNASAVTIAGFCSGVLPSVNWNNSIPTGVVFSSASLPGSPGACTITGTLNSAPYVYII